MAWVPGTARAGRDEVFVGVGSEKRMVLLRPWTNLPTVLVDPPSGQLWLCTLCTHHEGPEPGPEPRAAPTPVGQPVGPAAACATVACMRGWVAVLRLWVARHLWLGVCGHLRPAFGQSRMPTASQPSVLSPVAGYGYVWPCCSWVCVCVCGRCCASRRGSSRPAVHTQQQPSMHCSMMSRPTRSDGRSATRVTTLSYEGAAPIIGRLTM